MTVLLPLPTATGAISLLMRLGDGFRPERAGGVRATIEWRVETAAGVERLWMRIDDGSWLVTRDELDPSVTIELSLADLARLVEGRRAAVQLFMAQRLIAHGDVLLAVRLPDFFGLTPRRKPGPAGARTSPAALPGS
jgi:predicted lipid carrier protein YhbT